MNVELSLNAEKSLSPLILDTRPIFASGQTPCAAVDASLAALQPAQPLVILVPFEPVPLYTKLGNLGFTHFSEQLPDGTWRVEFRPTEGVDPGPARRIPACECGH